MHYDYQTQKPNLGNDPRMHIGVLAVFEAAKRLISSAGVVRRDRLLSAAQDAAGATGGVLQDWDAIACVDFLVETEKLYYVHKEDGCGQHNVLSNQQWAD